MNTCAPKEAATLLKMRHASPMNMLSVWGCRLTFPHACGVLPLCLLVLSWQLGTIAPPLVLSAIIPRIEHPNPVGQASVPAFEHCMCLSDE